jgi:hypothetical protein
MQAHQQRVVIEKEENDTKAKALSEFIGNNPIFETLNINEQERLKIQNDIMWQLSEILEARISAFGIISDCGCKFKNENSNAVLLCEKCSELPCHNR